MPAKKNTPSKKKSNVPAKKNLPSRRKSSATAIKRFSRKKDNLEEAIAQYMAWGWTLIGRSKRTAQLRKPKQFNWGWFFVWLITAIFLFGIPLLIYLIYYWTKQDETVTLSLDNRGNVLINGMESPRKAASSGIVASSSGGIKQNTKMMLFILAGIFILVLIISLLASTRNSSTYGLGKLGLSLVLLFKS